MMRFWDPNFLETRKSEPDLTYRLGRRLYIFLLQKRRENILNCRWYRLIVDSWNQKLFTDQGYGATFADPTFVITQLNRNQE